MLYDKNSTLIAARTLSNDVVVGDLCHDILAL